MLFKSFESKTFDDTIRKHTFKIRQALANIKDSFQYSASFPSYMNDKVINDHFKDCVTAIETLDSLSNFLRTGDDLPIELNLPCVLNMSGTPIKFFINTQKRDEYFDKLDETYKSRFSKSEHKIIIE